MTPLEKLDRIAINVKSHRLLDILLSENPTLGKILRESGNVTEVTEGVRNWIMKEFRDRTDAFRFYKEHKTNRELFDRLDWKDYAIIRMLDYIEYAGREYPDQNLRGEIAVSHPFRLLWLAVQKGTGGAKPDFFEDAIQLFRQLRGQSVQNLPPEESVEEWMERYPSGFDPRIVELRKENRDRILKYIIRRIDQGEIRDPAYRFEDGMTEAEKTAKALEWWKESRFHLKFAAREPEQLNGMLGNSLDPDQIRILEDARKAGIPMFVNPYYLSLLHVRVPYFAIGSDLAIRYYVLYSRQLVEEFGHIVAWEKEDRVEPGKPNAAGWLLPSHNNVHRRYPEVAIIIPDTMGRACGGLCASCQRMYDFQNGHLNFELDKLEPAEKWPEKLSRLLDYFEKDTQLRDILITGGDALMSSDRSLEHLLGEIVRMALRKQQRNLTLPEGKKLAEIVRIRLGTRLPVYLPQRITPGLLKILKDFKSEASKAGISQFIIQTHFESPMEITPEARKAVNGLISAGWMVTNQHVFTTASSRRGHNARLRQALNDAGILPYYTFTVKGYMENNFNFAPNARVVQEQLEEKSLGSIPAEHRETIRQFQAEAGRIRENIDSLRESLNLPFLATDRNVLNLPGVGKSLTFRTIGITRYGRRILQFDHDATRNHSPIINKMGKVVVIESKSIREYLKQIEELGEDLSEYAGLYGYSIGQTEDRMPLYEYPEYEHMITGSYSNLEV